MSQMWVQIVLQWCGWKEKWDMGYSEGKVCQMCFGGVKAAKIKGVIIYVVRRKIILK